MQIGVIGSGDWDEKGCSIAREVGYRIAKAGAYLVCGGLGGVMEAACQGAKEGGGTTIGILPGQSAQDANRWVDIKIVTGLGFARNSLVVNSSDGVIAISGSYGTLSEIAYAFVFNIPIVGIGTWSLSKEGHEPPPIVYVETPEEAVERIIMLTKKRYLYEAKEKK